MSTTLENTRPFGRFSTALSAGECPKPLYDEILGESGDCIVTPTLGSILPNWLLIVPRRRALSFARWFRETKVEPVGLVRNFLAQRHISKKRAIWFEHGPRNEGSLLGCGVEHAHLHMLIDAPFSFDEFVTEVIQSSNVTWTEFRGPLSYEFIPDDASYLLMASDDRHFVARNVEAVGSQFFRRVIAKMADQSDAWDYRKFPHIENVKITVDRFAG